MSSLSIPLPRQSSDNQFIGDLMALLQRRRVKCGDPRSFESFASELVSNAALRSDLFTLCMAISHMAAEDRAGEELLVLVARALRGPGVAKGSAVGEIPVAMRSAFLEGYEAWCNRAVAATDKPLPRPPMAGDEPSPADGLGPGLVVAEGAAIGERSIQMALNIVRERSPSGVIAFPLSGSGRRFKGDAGMPAIRADSLSARGGGVSIRISAIAILVLAILFLIATGLGGAYVYQSLHSAILQPSVVLKPVAKAIARPGAGMSYASPVPQAANAGPASSLSASSHARDVATPAVSLKAGRSIQRQPAIVLSAPGNQEVLVDSSSESDATAASDESAAQAGATAETHRVWPVYVPSTTMDELALAEPRPVYPADLPKGISGTVMLEVSISKGGDVTNARAVSGPVELRRVAEQALKEWRFRPYLVDGDPTEVTTTVGFFFNGR
jgi:TonB family protein